MSRSIAPNLSTRALITILAGVSLLAAPHTQDGTQTPTQTKGATKERPNVIVIVSDDQGWADIGYNNPAVYSPNLDKLSNAGARLNRAYVMPQCTPTRVALMTGRYPSRFGGNAQQASNAPAFPIGTPTMASMFKTQGYTTHIAGKWHLGSSPEHGPRKFGFETSYGSLTGAIGMYDHRYRKGKFQNTWHRNDALIEGHENGVHATDLVAREAIRVIQSERTKPYFLYLPFHAVHTPLDERGKFVDQPTQLDPEDETRWKNEDDIEWFHDPQGLIQREKDPEKRLLLAAIHHFDHAIGTILEALAASGEEGDTMIVFTSDNGPQGSWPGNAYPDDLKLTNFNQKLPMRGKKLDVWEGGIHVPSFVVWPRKIAAHRVEDPVHAVDWLPTFAAMLGFEDKTQAAMWDGVDLAPAIVDSGPLPDRDLYWTWSRRTNRWALRHGDWKIVRYGKSAPAAPGDWKLFNLKADPKERKDLATKRPEILTAMHARYLEHRKRDAQ